jgi:diguanylate cyclase (GGDEF)-like protein
MRRFHVDTGARSLRIRIPASNRVPPAGTPSPHTDSTAYDGTLERWLEADSLRSFCALAYEEFHHVFKVSRLLLVSWVGVRQCTWALHPGDDRVTRLIESVFSYPGTRISSLIINSAAQRQSPSPDVLTADPRLAEAGFDTYAVIETDSDVTYHIFWDDNQEPPSGKVAGQSVRVEQLWRVFKAALTNMARLERLRELSHIDFTTGVFNRRYFELRLTEEIARARRFQRPLSLAVLDIDDFKSLNDTYGHQAGDAILGRVAECVRWTTRSIDVFCRLGGDEFAVLMPDADLCDNPHMGERLRSVLAQRHWTVEGVPADTTVAVSVGGAVFPQHCDDESRLIWCADMALLEAKHQGRDRFVLYQETMGRPGGPSEQNEP